MAGIGFKLRKKVAEGRLSSLLAAYGYSSLLIAGPWIISIVGIFLVGFLGARTKGLHTTAFQFQCTITYLLALSLIVTSPVGLMFTRFVADSIFLKKEEEIIPNLLGALLLTLILAALAIILFVFTLLRHTDLGYTFFFCLCFLELCLMWILNVLMSGVKEYKVIFVLYFVSFLMIFLFSLYFKRFGLLGFMLSFYVGVTFLFFSFLLCVLTEFPRHYILSMDFFVKKGRNYPLYFLTGLFYTLGIWVDKFIFWYSPLTGQRVLGNLFHSMAYDLPISLAYLTIVPGMGIIFYRLEADFADSFNDFYGNVRSGGTLRQILLSKDRMIDEVKLAVREVVIIQGIFSILIFLFAENIFKAFKIDPIHIPLFLIELIGTQLHLGFIFLLSVLFYLDKQKDALWASSLFFILNAAFSYQSIMMGAVFYGYGFSFSILVSFILALVLVRRVMEDLEYETYAFA